MNHGRIRNFFDPNLESGFETCRKTSWKFYGSAKLINLFRDSTSEISYLILYCYFYLYIFTLFTIFGFCFIVKFHWAITSPLQTKGTGRVVQELQCLVLLAGRALYHGTQVSTLWQIIYLKEPLFQDSLSIFLAMNR